MHLWISDACCTLMQDLRAEHPMCTHRGEQTGHRHQECREMVGAWKTMSVMHGTMVMPVSTVVSLGCNAVWACDGSWAQLLQR